MDEEALKEMLEEEAMSKKAQEEKIRQEQAENDAFFLEFGIVRISRCVSYCFILPVIIIYCYVPHLASSKLLPARLFSASSALICNIEISFFAAARESCNSDIRSSLSSVSARRVLISTSMSSSLAVTSSGLSSDVSDAGLPSEKVVASGWDNDDGDLLLFREGPVQVIRLPERLESQVFLEWNVPWQLPVLGSCQARCWKVIETFLEYTLHTTE
ncbi:hypothetical protein Tco_1072142 [Tanacetum coccineum]